MNTIIANRIFIEDPSDNVIKWAKENLCFPNPEFEKKQRMGFWVGRTPRELRLYEWNGNTLILPFGVIRNLMPLLRDTIVLCDFRQDSIIDYGGKSIDLYDYQRDAINKMLSEKYGILKAPCGSGKTVMGIALIKAFRRRALWLCHTHELLKQSMDTALEYMNPDMIGVITEGKANIGVGVTFATVQTVANLELTQYRDYWDVVIVDEVHRCSASATSFTRYEKVLNHLSARHKLGLSATPVRGDGLIKATFALVGEVAYEVPDKAVANKTMKVKVRRINTDTDITDECLNGDGTINYTKLIGHIVSDPERNKLIARKIMEEKGHSCIILSDRLAQLESIRNLMPYEMQEESAFINGKMTSKAAKAEREQAIDDMRTGKKKYLFASYNLCHEGLNIPRLDRLFMASPVKFSSIVIQSVGRIARTFEGKDVPVCFDFVDENIGFCERLHKERCRSYRKIGAEIEKGS